MFIYLEHFKLVFYQKVKSIPFKTLGLCDDDNFDVQLFIEPNLTFHQHSLSSSFLPLIPRSFSLHLQITFLVG
uniref:Putative ovule protein n=1 Tax=Solanum chacoense TaxID=4108 RepID=A0A0V0HMV3_SOLCH